MINSMNNVINEATEKMEKSVKSVAIDFSKLRTGKASPALIEDVPVDAYGQAMPMKQLASISVPDARMIVIQPWDKGMLEVIEKGIQKADLGLNPQNDGNIIRLAIPPLSEERRKELVKLAKRLAEEGKVAIRSIRRSAIDALKKLEKDKDISEDIKIRGDKEIQKITDSHIVMIDETLETKEQEILTV